MWKCHQTDYVPHTSLQLLITGLVTFSTFDSVFISKPALFLFLTSSFTLNFASTLKRARARVEDEKAEESSNPDSNGDIIRIQAEVEKTTTEAEAAGERDPIRVSEIKWPVSQLNRKIAEKVFYTNTARVLNPMMIMWGYGHEWNAMRTHTCPKSQWNWAERMTVSQARDGR